MKKYMGTLWMLLPIWLAEFKYELAEYEKQSDPRTMDLAKLKALCEGKQYFDPRIKAFELRKPKLIETESFGLEY